MIKYKYLRAWDLLLHSSQGWMDQRQLIAEAENAPLDAIYRDTDGTWHCFSEIKSKETQERVQFIADNYV